MDIQISKYTNGHMDVQTYSNPYISAQYAKMLRLYITCACKKLCLFELTFLDLQMESLLREPADLTGNEPRLDIPIGDSGQ